MPEAPDERNRLEGQNREHWRAFDEALIYTGLERNVLDRAIETIVDRRLTKEERLHIRELLIAKSKAQRQIPRLRRERYRDQESYERWHEQVKMAEQTEEEIKQEIQRLNVLASRREQERQERWELSPEEKMIPLTWQTIGLAKGQAPEDTLETLQVEEEKQEHKQREQVAREKGAISKSPDQHEA